MAEANNVSDARAEEIAALKQQIQEMQKRLDELSEEPCRVSAPPVDEAPLEPQPQQPQPQPQQPEPQQPQQPEPQQPQQPWAQQPGSRPESQQPRPEPVFQPHDPYIPNFYQQPTLRAKDHVAAGLLGIFLGMFGIHKFYLGYNTPGFIMLGVTVLGGLVTFGLALSVVWLIGLIEGVIYLVKSQQDFERTYVVGKKEWF